MITNKVRDTIRGNNLIEKNGHIVLGLSGGPDSVCLFHILHELSKENGTTIHAVHINHKFRPGAAEADQAYVQQLCEDYKTDCRVFTFDCKAIAKELGITGEEAGRKVRYESFYKTALDIMKEYSVTNVKVAVAHNMDDQAETLLLRLIRGTGTDGLAGMDYKRSVKQVGKQIEIIRPLLDIDRESIEKYCIEHGLNPRIDHTNLEPIYTRNKIRLNLIPYIDKNFGGSVKESLNRLAKIAGEDKSYLWEQARKAREDARIAEADTGMERTMGGEIYSTDRLRELHPAIRHRVIMDIFADLGLTQDITHAHLAAADRAVASGQTGKTIEFPQGYRFFISYGKAVFQHEEAEDGQGLENEKTHKLITRLLSKQEWYDLRASESFYKEKSNLGNSFAIFDLNKLCREHNLSPGIETDGGYMNPEQQDLQLQEKLQLVLRTRKEGDYLTLDAEGGTKKLQNYFVDKKVPKELRDDILLAARGSEVLWVIDDRKPQQERIFVTKAQVGTCGEPPKDIKWGRTGGKYKVSEETERILLLELIPIL